MPAPAVWTPSEIDAQCKAGHARYVSSLKQHYTEYFAARPEEAGTQAWSARDLRAALPPGFEMLEVFLAAGARHRHHLSAGSSQVVALALIGAAQVTRPEPVWYSGLLDLPVPAAEEKTRLQFEFALDAQLLGERANFPTTIDVLSSHSRGLSCAEAKYWEAGLGRCGCLKKARERLGRDAADPTEPGGACSPDILKRHKYWVAARDVLDLPSRAEGDACPIASGYQGVRNVAAARELSDGRSAAFVLFYDERNPYFAATGSWPGWPAYSRERFESGDRSVEFRSCSWQRLLGSGAVPGAVVEWARVKHGLEPSSDLAA